MQQADTNTVPYSLLVIIVHRGTGKQVLEFCGAHGAKEAIRYMGEGTDKRQLLKVLGLDEVERDVVTMVIPIEQERLILDEVRSAFSLYRPGTGIAFTLPLVYVLKSREKKHIRFQSPDLEITPDNSTGYVLMLAIWNKGVSAQLFEFFSATPWFGGTLVKAVGQTASLEHALNIQVEPAKEVLMMIISKEKVNQLIDILDEQVGLRQQNTGILAVMEISWVVGLFEQETRTRS